MTHTAEEAFNEAREAKMQISHHEEICSVRYANIDEKLSNNTSSIESIKKFHLKTAMAVISLLITILVKLLFFAE